MLIKEDETAPTIRDIAGLIQIFTYLPRMQVPGQGPEFEPAETALNARMDTI